MSKVLEGLAPYFYQVAYVIPDMATAQEWCKRVFGVRHFGTLEAEMGTPEAPFFYRGKPARASITLALGDMNGTEIKLIEPRSKGSLWAEHLKTAGPGLHHVCFMVPEFEPAMNLFKANGFDPVIQGSNRNGGLHVEFAYFDCRAQGALRRVDMGQRGRTRLHARTADRETILTGRGKGDFRRLNPYR